MPVFPLAPPLGGALKNFEFRSQAYIMIKQLSVTLLATFCITPLVNASVFVDWDASFQGSAPGISIANVFSVSPGALELDTFTATDAVFLASYSQSIPSLGLMIEPAGIDAQFAFSTSTPLPTGSRLMVFDFDALDERMNVSSGGAPLVLDSQVETQSGASSTFPDYDAATGELTRSPFTSDNPFEATLFDISGLDSFDVTADRSLASFASGLRIAVSVPSSPTDPPTSPSDPPSSSSVPEPASWLIVLVLFSMTGASRLWKTWRVKS